MITEDSVSDNNEKKPLHEEVSQENNSDNTTNTNAEVEIHAEEDATPAVEEALHENPEIAAEEVSPETETEDVVKTDEVLQETTE
ncbi:MAG: DUF349 domain-containing protein, partial [Kaistella sp.]